MAEYRLYFTDEKGAIQAREEFRSDDDASARAIVNLLSQACSECYPGYELWSFNRRIVAVRDGAPTITRSLKLEEVGRARQEVILQLEDQLQHSRWRVANSRRLMQATAGLKGLLRDGGISSSRKVG